MKIAAVVCDALSTKYEKRYVIVDMDTGEVLDNAQGYGYRTPQGAHAAFAYKGTSKAAKRKKVNKEREIQRWLKEHKEFCKALETFQFEIAKGSWGPDAKFSADLVRKMLKDSGYKVDFGPGELLRAWKKM